MVRDENITENLPIKYEVVEQPYLLLPCNLSDLDEIKTFDDKITYIKSCLGQIDKNNPFIKNEIQETDLPFIRDIVLDLNQNEKLLYNMTFGLNDLPKFSEHEPEQEETFEMEENPLFQDFEENPLFEIEENPLFELEENPANY